jgi:hypothetical protein
MQQVDAHHGNASAGDKTLFLVLPIPYPLSEWMTSFVMMMKKMMKMKN